MKVWYRSRASLRQQVKIQGISQGRANAGRLAGIKLLKADLHSASLPKQADVRPVALSVQLSQSQRLHSRPWSGYRVGSNDLIHCQVSGAGDKHRRVTQWLIRPMIAVSGYHARLPDLQLDQAKELSYRSRCPSEGNAMSTLTIKCIRCMASVQPASLAIISSTLYRRGKLLCRSLAACLLSRWLRIGILSNVTPDKSGL